LQYELIGFDVRLERSAYLPAQWMPERREMFLIEPRVDWPWSVDLAVWPSLFDDPAASALFPDPLGPLLLQPDLTEWRQQAIGLWSCHRRMIERVSAAGAADRSVAVAIELVTETGMLDHQDWRNRLEGVPAPDPTDWALAGFDVADIGFTSALMNCGFLDEEKPSVQKRWASLLNRHGLFDEVQAAVDYRLASDARVSEHAPFYVFAIRVAPPALFSGRAD
jgi:hypothetical protein